MTAPDPRPGRSPTRAQRTWAAIERHRWAGAFVVLSIACTWVPLFAVLRLTGDPTASSGSTALWVLGGLGPAIAAFAIAAAGDGREGIRALARGMLHWRLGRWYLLLLAPLPVGAAAVLIAAVTGPAELDMAGLAEWYLLPVLFVGGVILGGFEEVGWRGYLLPRLQERWSALTASVAVGLVWSVWHTPLFLMQGTTQASVSIVWFTVQAVALSIVLTWAYNSTRGSVLLAVLAHGALNAWYTAAVQWLAPDTLETFTAYAALILVAGAAVLLWHFGPRDLSAQPRNRWSTGIPRDETAGSPI